MLTGAGDGRHDDTQIDLQPKTRSRCRRARPAEPVRPGHRRDRPATRDGPRRRSHRRAVRDHRSRRRGRPRRAPGGARRASAGSGLAVRRAIRARRDRRHPAARGRRGGTGRHRPARGPDPGRLAGPDRRLQPRQAGRAGRALDDRPPARLPRTSRRLPAAGLHPGPRPDARRLPPAGQLDPRRPAAACTGRLATTTSTTRSWGSTSSSSTATPSDPPTWRAPG